MTTTHRKSVIEDSRDVREELAELKERVARLEQQAQRAGHQEEEHPLAKRVEEKFAQADETARQYPIGEVRLQAYFRIHRPQENEYGRFVDGHTAGLDALLALPSNAVARSLAGLAHPARLEIYKALLTGSKDSATLLAAAGLNTTGQLYHHLREMEEVGLVVRRGRNLWAQTNLHAYAYALAVAKYLMDWRGDGKRED